MAPLGSLQLKFTSDLYRCSQHQIFASEHTRELETDLIGPPHFPWFISFISEDDTQSGRINIPKPPTLVLSVGNTVKIHITSSSPKARCLCCAPSHADIQRRGYNFREHTFSPFDFGTTSEPNSLIGITFNARNERSRGSRGDGRPWVRVDVGRELGHGLQLPQYAAGSGIRYVRLVQATPRMNGAQPGAASGRKQMGESQ
jgi:hypothetical protein